MELTTNETNLATILGGEAVLEDLVEQAVSEGWSRRKLTEALEARGALVSPFGARQLMMKWKDTR